MRFGLPLRPLLLCMAVVAATGCGSDGPGITEPGPEPEPTSNPSYVKLQSDPGDYIGAGRSYEYTQANSVIKVMTQGGLIAVNVDGDELWNAGFKLPAGMATIQKGTYAGLQRYPFHDPAKGGLDWNGDGRGCNMLTGSVTVDSVTYTGGALTLLHLQFVQHCEGSAPALRGTIHWRADDKTVPPGPVTPVPAGLWKPAAGAVPGSGNYVYLRSDAGDWIGQGQTYVYTPATTPITVTGTGGHVSIGVGGWGSDFQAMNSVTQLKPGYYGNIRRFPFHNPTRGGMDWGGNGRGCNTLTGWFVVDHVAYSGPNITALDLRFEQHCEGGTPALRGAIRWRA
ncbi:MAG TPA: hypothetical protein VGB15_18315 [Longimicrobium sp.]|jgi:hypothetical protein